MKNKMRFQGILNLNDILLKKILGNFSFLFFSYNDFFFLLSRILSIAHFGGSLRKHEILSKAL